MIDYERIQQTIVRVCDILVGEDLTRMGDTPAIIREYSSILRPKAPYLLFDITDLGRSSYEGTEEYFDTTDYKAKISSIHDISVRFTSYGDGAKKIISKLYSGFQRPSVRDRIVKEVPELAITDMRGIKTIEVFYDTQYVTSCYFTVIFGYVNTEVDPFAFYIDGINLTTTLYEAAQPDFITTIDIPSQPPILNNISGNN